MIPGFTMPQQIHIVVSDGPGKQSQIGPPFTTVMRPVMVLGEK
jgi:hypothetical protein